MMRECVLKSSRGFIWDTNTFRAALSCRVLCSAVLRYAVLCCATLCYAALRCATLRLPVGAALYYAPSDTLGCVT